MSNQNEHTVELKGADAETAVDLLSKAGDLGSRVIEYVPVSIYNTFHAKYTLRGSDIIVLFFPDGVFSDYAEAVVSDEKAEKLYALQHQHVATSWPHIEKYWLETFPSQLSDVAQEHFGAGFPRLQAKYTEEVNSWWLKAQGYDHIIDLVGFMSAFFEKLHQALDAQRS